MRRRTLRRQPLANWTADSIAERVGARGTVLSFKCNLLGGIHVPALA